MSARKPSWVERTRQFVRDLLRADWAKVSARCSLACLPAIALPLAVGLLTHHLRGGVISAAGAFAIGFGSFQRIRQRRSVPMIAAAFGICVSSWIGTFSGESLAASICVTGLGGVLYGAISFSSPGVSWVSLQSLIWLVISTAFPASGNEIPVRGSLLLAGGILQIVFLNLLWKFGFTPPEPYGTGQARESGVIETLRGRFTGHPGQLAYPLRAGITLAVATAIYRLAPFANSYWIPMTVVLVLKPDMQQRMLRATQRMAGTIAGAALATAVIGIQLQLPDPHFALAVLVVCFAWLGYTFLFVNYAYFAVALTSYVIFLLTLAGLPEKTLVTHRVLATTVGGALVVVSDAVAIVIRRRLSKRAEKKRGAEARKRAA